MTQSELLGLWDHESPLLGWVVPVSFSLSRSWRKDLQEPGVEPGAAAGWETRGPGPQHGEKVLLPSTSKEQSGWRCHLVPQGWCGCGVWRVGRCTCEQALPPQADR